MKRSGDLMKFNFFKTPCATVLIAVLMAGSSLASAKSLDEPTTRDVAIGISDVFIPGGFDSEADSYVVVSGMFPNGCYRWKAAEVKNVNALTHEIRSVAAVSQGMCIMVFVPFSKEVRLGLLASGNHILRFVNGDGTFLERNLKIE